MKFFIKHAEEISQLPVDMQCLNSQIIREIAKNLQKDRLESLKERKDKLVSRLFMKKLEILLEKETN
jgi:hypothetical protein